MSKKKVKGYVKLQVAAGAATPSPPVGPALGQQGVNIMEFCKSFNARTAHLEKGLPTPVVITVYVDRSFSFIIKTPPASVLIKKALNLKSGSQKPGSLSCGTLSKAACAQIAEMKREDMTGLSPEACMRSIAGTARSMGVEVEGGQDAS